MKNSVKSSGQAQPPAYALKSYAESLQTTKSPTKQTAKPVATQPVISLPKQSVVTLPKQTVQPVTKRKPAPAEASNPLTAALQLPSVTSLSKPSLPKSQRVAAKQVKAPGILLPASHKKSRPLAATNPLKTALALPGTQLLTSPKVSTPKVSAAQKRAIPAAKNAVADHWGPPSVEFNRPEPSAPVVEPSAPVVKHSAPVAKRNKEPSAMERALARRLGKTPVELSAKTPIARPTKTRAAMTTNIPLAKSTSAPAYNTRPRTTQVPSKTVSTRLEPKVTQDTAAVPPRSPAWPKFPGIKGNRQFTLQQPLNQPTIDQPANIPSLNSPTAQAASTKLLPPETHPNIINDPSLEQVVEPLTDQGIVYETTAAPGIAESTTINMMPSGNVMSSANPDIPRPVSHGSFGRFLQPYRARAYETDDGQPTSLIDSSALLDARADGSQHELPSPDSGFDMWWESQLVESIGIAQQTLPIDIANLTQTALSSSPYVRAILTEPHIRRTDIVVADAEFDTMAFLEGRFTDTNEPVGSALTTGDNSTRFRDETFTSAGGVRKKTRAGGEYELSQRGGFQENNSTFLNPNPQGTTRLEFNFTQPLMRDRGTAVNNTRILLARLDLQMTNASVRSDLEDHLIQVTRAYWDLFQARAEWLQGRRLLDGAERLHRIMQARDGVDSQRRQILRTRAALTSRQSDLVRVTTRIRDTQAKLRLLTGSQQLVHGQQLELTPQDQPLEYSVDVSASQSVATALDNRSDIAQAIRKVQAVSTRVGAAKNQVLPRLDLILGAYAAGLDDERDTVGAFGRQLSEGRPTYWAGLSYELPIGMRASKARLNRNRWEMCQAMYEFQQATEVAFTEVEVAVRETKTAFNEMIAKKRSIDAAQNEVAYLQQRWEFLPDPNESAVLLIEDLLDAQERLADEERAFVTAQVSYAMSWIQLRKVTGVLLRFDAHSQATSLPVTNNDPAANYFPTTTDSPTNSTSNFLPAASLPAAQSPDWDSAAVERAKKVRAAETPDHQTAFGEYPRESLR